MIKITVEHKDSKITIESDIKLTNDSDIARLHEMLKSISMTTLTAITNMNPPEYIDKD